MAYADVIEFLKPHQQNMTEAAAKVQKRIKVKEWDAHFSQRKDNWAQHRVVLPAVESGIYLVEAVVEQISFRVTVLVNRYGLIVKSAADSAIVFAQGRTDGKPVEGMDVRLVARAGSWNRTTDANGLARFDTIRDNVLLIGKVGEEYCFCYAYASQRHGPESRVYVSTDRPIYRPDQEVRFKVRHRVDEDGKLAVKKGLRFTVNVRDTKNHLVHAEQVELNEFGSAHGTFKLSAEPPLGVYSIHIEPLEGMPGQWNRWSNRGQFRVDEYRKPEFEVNVSFGEARYIMGDTLQGKVEARYFFGSPVADAKVTWEVRRSQHWSWWRPRPSWYAWYGDGKQPSYGGGEVVASGKGTTNAKGELDVSLDVPRAEHDQRYTLTATVTDLSRRQEVGSSTVMAYRANVAVHVATERYVYLPGQQLAADLEVRDHDRKPVAGARVTVRAMRRVWSALTKSYREVELSANDATTDAEGKARVELHSVASGSIVLRATVKDAQERETSAHRWVWVTSRDWDGGTMNWRGISIVPDKEAYAPGDTATFLVTSEVKDLHLLFTLEANRVYFHKVVKLAGHATTLQIKLDDPGLLPNFFASVVALHGNKTYRRDVNIAIDPRDRFLDIEIKPSQKQYKPGEPASFDVFTRQGEWRAGLGRGRVWRRRRGDLRAAGGDERRHPAVLPAPPLEQGPDQLVGPVLGLGARCGRGVEERRRPGGIRGRRRRGDRDRRGGRAEGQGERTRRRLAIRSGVRRRQGADEVRRHAALPSQRRHRRGGQGDDPARGAHRQPDDVAFDRACHERAGPHGRESHVHPRPQGGHRPLANPALLHAGRPGRRSRRSCATTSTSRRR